MCSYMLDLGLPAAAYDENAVSVIDNIIIKMPTSIAYSALDQFVTTDKLRRQKKYYLSCLGKRRFTLLERTKERFKPASDSPTALEVKFYVVSNIKCLTYTPRCTKFLAPFFI